MKKTTLLAVLFLSVVLFSCNNAESSENNENSDSTVVESEDNTDAVSDNSEGIDNFDVFWSDFQTAVAADNENAVLALCNQDVKDFIEAMGYGFIFDDEMKQQIANRKASDVEVVSDQEKLFIYIIEYPSDGAETFSSSFGFYIGKTNGKWLLTIPAFAG